MSDPLTFVWDETHGAMFPLGRLRSPAEERFIHGKLYQMEVSELADPPLVRKDEEGLSDV